ncbi:hypothetical protein EC973_003335 [Apophysomyces ossiformis]|uniref:RanBP2-type domain-containing protein n=1 Tax=Apophysomyces ossiformis TaxID=679940 RepID=A0A8H7BTU7_9FUNG|nr:hypothetical protein EC973_003335 [Apophysomyces ossiformis]
MADFTTNACDSPLAECLIYADDLFLLLIELYRTFKASKVTGLNNSDCVHEKIGVERVCPTCQLPAIVKNLRKDPMHDTLVACVKKLKTKLINSSLTPLTMTLEREPVALDNIPQTTPTEVQQHTSPAGSPTPDLDQLPLAEANRLVTKEETTGLSPNAWSVLESLPASLNCESLLDDMMVDTVEVDQPAASPVIKDTNAQKIVANKSATTDALPSSSTLPRKRSLSDNRKSAQVSKKSVRAKDFHDLKWQCSRCLFSNPESEPLCGICRLPRDTGRTALEKPGSIPSNDVSTMNTFAIHDAEFNVVPASQKEDGVLSYIHTSMQIAHVLCTGLNAEDTIRFDQSIILVTDTDLSINVYSDIRDMDEVGHVITSVDENRFCPRTLKYLHAILAGKWVVEISWLIDSIEARQWLPEEPYEVLGDTTTGISNAPAVGRQQRAHNAATLFEDWKFYFFGDFSNRYKKADLLQLCRSAGGKILARRPGPHKEASTGTRPPVILVPSMTDLGKKKSSWLQQYDVKDAAWLIDSISRYAIP